MITKEQDCLMDWYDDIAFAGGGAASERLRLADVKLVKVPPAEIPRLYAWKRLADGAIVQQAMASKAALFEAAGFGAVRMDEPRWGYLAIEVVEKDGTLIEVPL